MTDIKTNPAEEEIQKNWQKRINELTFNARAINNASDDFIQKLSSAHQSIQKTLQSLENSADQQEKAVDQMKLESGVLSLIPEKVQSRIDSIIPEIAKEIDQIYGAKSAELNKEFKNLKNDLTESLETHRKKISETTEKWTEAMEQKVLHFSDRALKEADDLKTTKRRKLFKILIVVILASGLVSGLISYLVTAYFPRYVEIKGAHDVSVTGSQVSAYGTNVSISSSSINNPDYLHSKQKPQK